MVIAAIVLSLPVVFGLSSQADRRSQDIVLTGG